ncbi:Cof-type HAD-IIB family hydrolase [Furfurilactobacillus siliginis]|uniref:HAD superfamily hydrolase n=1 Tax=Furfurilactobacillus siliginis TaxID=348151 RepID=A0A0R2LBY0_9LACO|nr:Cof-type HAD-IIB family hydrolase [Furfurilactobacillus siliginis]KRN96157.1 HAD superfamily hydrolase [Furfurilactobacillus siliginis]GEK27919.1 sugar phosphatase SupH [Furfurilactobacillus siliginis]
MSIKLIAVDMDGTFLNDDNDYNRNRFAAQFRRLQARGIHFAAASGSQYQRLIEQFTPFKDDMDFISDNGAIVHARDELLFASQIPDDLVRNTLQVLATHYPQPMALTTLSGVNRAYVDTMTPDPVFKLIGRYYNALEKMDDLFAVNPAQLDDQLVKIAVSFAKDVDTTSAIPELLSHLDSSLSAMNSGFNTEDIGLTGVSKASGLRHLQERYGIESNEIASFGDNENDLDMLTMTPHGYAMANAAEDVLNQAPLRTDSNNEDGVLNVIDRILAE